MSNFDKFFKILIDMYEDYSRGRIMLFCAALTVIFLIIDTMLTFTYPALTLIGLVITLWAFVDKTYQKYLTNKPHFWDKK